MERPELTQREHDLLNALQRINGWLVHKLEPIMSGTVNYELLQRDMRIASQAIEEATGGNES